jgi:hypothetical protein
VCSSDLAVNPSALPACGLFVRQFVSHAAQVPHK